MILHSTVKRPGGGRGIYDHACHRHQTLDLASLRSRSTARPVFAGPRSLSITERRAPSAVICSENRMKGREGGGEGKGGHMVHVLALRSFHSSRQAPCSPPGTGEGQKLISRHISLTHPRRSTGNARAEHRVFVRQGPPAVNQSVGFYFDQRRQRRACRQGRGKSQLNDT